MSVYASIHCLVYKPQPLRLAEETEGTMQA